LSLTVDLKEMNDSIVLYLDSIYTPSTFPADYVRDLLGDSVDDFVRYIVDQETLDLYSRWWLFNYTPLGDLVWKKGEKAD